MTERDAVESVQSAPRGRHPMEALFKQKSDGLKFLKLGDIVEGRVISKKGSRICVDLGPQGTGIIYGREYYLADEVARSLEPGQAITAKVVDLDNEEGYVELSLREAGREKLWQELRDVMRTGELIPLTAREANRGGLILEYRGVPGFLPASQLSSDHYPRVEGGDKAKIFEALKKLVGLELMVAIIDVDPREGKLIFSEKSKESALLRERLRAYQVGDVIEGEVAGLVSFGAFVKFGEGLEGLVHISEIDWQLIANPADVLKVGQKVRAKIIGIEGDKVSLSLKALREDPWAGAAERYKKGDVVQGTVVKFNLFGAFIKLEGGIQALAHISEFGTEAKMKETLKLGEPHEFKILSVDEAEHRMALGLVQDEEPPAPEADTSPTAASPETPGPPR